MPELSVAVFATDNDQRAVLQVLVDGTSVARTASPAIRHATHSQRSSSPQDSQPVSRCAPRRYFVSKRSLRFAHHRIVASGTAPMLLSLRLGP